MKLCLICNFQTAGEQDICPRDGSSMVTVGDDPLLGMVVEGRYKIESVIGQGSAGTVYKAVQELIGREVAIKVLHDYLVSDQEFIKRFTQEAKASSRLSHPNIITIYDFGVIPKGGRPYIAMDLLKGTPLSDLLSERNHLTVDEAIPVFKQVCGALAEAHRQGVVHRDIKPENIVLVERSGQKLFPIVVDFGIARLVQEESDVARITRTGTVCGSPTYMSPEQCTSSKVDHRSDIYSLGVVIYETLTGEVPFLSDELVKVMAMHLSDPPKPLNSVREDLQFPEALEEVVYRSLAKNPDQRFQTMEELSDALEEAAKQPIEQHPVLVSPKRPEITPGPLAQDEDLVGRRTSKEMGAPRTKQMDLASRALEELRTSGAYDEAEVGAQEARIQAAAASARATLAAQAAQEALMYQPDTSSSQAHSRTNFDRVKNRRSLWPSLVKRLVLALTAVGILGALVYAATTDVRLARFLPWNSMNTFDVDTLVKDGKLEEALYILQSLRQQGRMTKPQSETLAKVCVSLAKQYARAKRYDDSIALLEQVPARSAQADVAKALLKRYEAIEDK